MVEKLVCVIMGQNCGRFIGMCLESVKESDAIVYCDGGSKDKTLNIVGEYCHGFEMPDNIIQNEYNQKDKGMNGKQRQFYLDYLKKNYKDWWCLALDADEVVEDLQKIKDFINVLPKENHDVLFSIKMRHFIGNLGQEDATQPIHFVPNRLFKIRDNLEYPLCEHPVLGLKDKVIRNKK